MAFSKRQTAAENVRSVQFAGPSAALGPLLRPVQRPTLRPGGSATNRPLLLPPPASQPAQPGAEPAVSWRSFTPSCAPVR